MLSVVSSDTPTDSVEENEPDMNTQTAITVIVPAYNYAKTLGRAVRSVLPQLSDQDELIVIDDGSTDETPAVIEKLEQESASRFRAVRKENGGLASVRNMGIQIAANDWLIFLDADDEMADSALIHIREHLGVDTETRMVIGGHCSIEESGRRRIHVPDALPSNPMSRVKAYLLDKTLSISNGACVMHRSIFAQATYPETFRNAEDIPVFAQTLGYFPCSVLPHPLALIYKHADSLRHQFHHAKAGGLALVDEVFSARRLTGDFLKLRSEFYVQRCLSLFRTAYLAGEFEIAKSYYRSALKEDWKVLFKFAYSRKMLRLCLKG